MPAQNKVRFTVPRVNEFTCPLDKQQAFAWDTETPGLGLRATAKGAKAYVFESKLSGKTIRITIGSPKIWTISNAQVEARRLQTFIDRGQDPRVQKAESIAKDAAVLKAKVDESIRKELLARDAWNVYCQIGKTQGIGRKIWGNLHIRDHEKLSQCGGEKAKIGEKKNQPGILFEILQEPLSSINVQRIERWLAVNSSRRPAQTNLAFRLLRAFLNWTGEQEDYKNFVDSGVHQVRSIRSKLPQTKTKNDCLQSLQVNAWFKSIRQISNPINSVYLECLLLTGSRPGELIGLRWKDVDFKWKTLLIRDKNEGNRVIPLTDHVADLLHRLPKSDSEWVFFSPKSKSGHIVDVSKAHRVAVANAGIGHLTLHGLRRSFASLSEWLQVPLGVVAQIQGHKPSATREKHYIRRELGLLWIWHDKIEKFILSKVETGDIALGH